MKRHKHNNQLNTHNHLIHPSYRPDIDGLRAIAVLSVVGFHAFPKIFKGGFVGVDIFFVISGFLISTIIFNSLEKNSFSFIEFYSRRIRRIFPSLIVVLIATLVFGYFSLLADEYASLGNHVAGGAGFISNILLWGESGYFDRSSDLKPLLHLWSLGIEEQFYIMWPFLAYLAWKRKLDALSVTAIVIVLSFSFSLYLTKTNPAAGFYSPISRFWELLIGSLIAYFIARKTKASSRKAVFLSDFSQSINPQNNFFTNPIFNNLASFFGVILIICGLIITREKYFPGLWALVPTVGAALTICAGKDAWVNKNILSNRYLVFIGLISFPIYLWHWPIISFGHILFGQIPPPSLRVVSVITSVFLAWCTYKLVEQPIRNGLLENKKTIALLILMSMLGCVGYYIKSIDGFSSRYPVHNNDYETRVWHLKGDGIIDCSHLVNATTSSFCAKTKETRLAIIGDSHAGHLFYGFSRSADDGFNKVIVIGAGSCQPTLDFEAREGCNNQLKVAIQLIAENESIKYVVLSGYYGVIENESGDVSKKYIDGIQKTIDELKKRDKKIIFFIDNPSLKETAERCQPRSLLLRELFNPYPDYCKGAEIADLRDQNAYRHVINKVARRNPDVFFFDPKNVICPNGKCDLFVNGALIYGDWNHLSIYGSQMVVNAFIDKYEK